MVRSLVTQAVTLRCGLLLLYISFFLNTCFHRIHLHFLVHFVNHTRGWLAGTPRSRRPKPLRHRFIKAFPFQSWKSTKTQTQDANFENLINNTGHLYMAQRHRHRHRCCYDGRCLTLIRDGNDMAISHCVNRNSLSKLRPRAYWPQLPAPSRPAAKINAFRSTNTSKFVRLRLRICNAN